jgi:hypothetical protein
MKNSVEKKIIDKVKGTSAFLWSLRLALIAILGGGGVIMTNAKELAGWLAKDTIQAEIKESERRTLDTMEKQFSNLIELLAKADTSFKKAAIEKAERDRDNKTLLNAIKGDNQ